jgi:branched-chain amino acid transport system substrate-binding protein
MRRRFASVLAAALALVPVLALPAAAQVRIGVIVSITGPSASQGVPQRNSLAMLPKGVGNQRIEYIVLDDGTDAARAVAGARKLIDEDGVDAIVGPSTTPASLALIPIAAAKQVPVIAFGASGRIILPMDQQRRWMFKTSQNDGLMADAIALHMFRAGVRTVGFIGFGDAYGDGWLAEAKRALEGMTIKLVAVERYARADTDVSAQAQKLIAAQPDAVLVAGSGSPSVTPQKALRSLGYSGKYYQTHGAATIDFIKLGGKDVEGTVLPAGPVLVASQLPDSDPVKETAQGYVRQYEAAYGAGSVAPFGAYAYDAATLLKMAIPVALLTAKPGTPEFRASLRNALETAYDLVLTDGVAEMTPDDHSGFDKRARVM